MKYKLPIIYFLIFALICLASIFILHHANQIESSADKQNHLNSFIISGTNIEYNQQGQLKSKITSQKISHFLPEKTSVFEKPRMIVYSDDRTPWHIHADQATVNHTGEKIVLEGQVIIRELTTAQTSDATTITTSELTVFPKESRASTNKPVTLSRPGMTIHGVGFDANLKTGQYKLRSQSKAIYQFQSKNKRN